MRAVIGTGCGNDSTRPVGSKPKGVSPYGAHDMAGNVWEWTSTFLPENDCNKSDGCGGFPNVGDGIRGLVEKSNIMVVESSKMRCPLTPLSSYEKMLKCPMIVGGGWMNTYSDLSLSYRLAIGHCYARSDIGFRCARSSD